MKAFLASTVLFIVVAVLHAQQAPTLEQQQAASGALAAKRYPDALNPYSRISQIAEKLLVQWKEKQDWRLNSPDFPIYIWEAADAQRKAEEQTAAHSTVSQTQQAPTFEQQRAASGAAVLKKYPEALDANSHLTRCADKLLLEWQAAKDWRLESPNLPMFLWDCAEIQRQLELKLAQIRATNYAPATTPLVSPARRPSPAPSSTTIISGSGGVYTTHGGGAGGSTIINTGAGHYQIRTKDGQTQRVIITSP